MILDRFGSMELKRVIAPAIRICQEGYEINNYYALEISSHMQLMSQ
jgi:gamma-glutamyltranspeptidase